MNNSDESLTAIFVDDEEDGADNVIDLLDFGDDNHLQEHVETEISSIATENPTAKEKESASVVITDFLQRRRAQFAGKTRSKKQYAFLVFLIILCISTVIVLTLESPFYDVDKVVVKNLSTSLMSEEESNQISDITSGIKGDQTYRLELDAVRQDIKELPYVKSVEVSKKWPSTVNVTLYKRVAVAVIETDQGYVLVDDQGIVFEKTSAPDKALPIFEGMREVTYTKVIPNNDFMEIVEAVPQDMKGQILRIALKENTYSAILSDGITIKLGKNSQMEEKMAIAWSIILTKGRKDLGYIDVSVPSIPVSGPPQLANSNPSP